MDAANPDTLDPSVLDAMERSILVQYDRAPVGFLCVSMAGTIGKINRTLLDWLGYERTDLVGKKRLHDLVGPGARLYLDTQHVSLLLLQGCVHDIAVDLRARDGTAVPTLVNTVLERGADGKPLFMHMSIFNASERRRYERELLHAKQQAERAAVTLDQRVLERTSQLACALDRAESAVRAKNDFLANMSHEVRTPLNCILGMTHLLRDGVRTQPERDYLDTIVQAGNSVVRIVSDILDFCKMDAGKLAIESLPMDIRAVIAGTAARFGALAGARGLRLDVDIDPAVPRQCMGDALRLAQVLSNYLDNAIKFTEQGGIEVRVGAVACADGRRLRIEVRDTGIGLSLATQARLFQPFSQADTSTTRRYGGTGLGLAICRQLADLMGGCVGVAGGVGGSTFWVEIPLADAAAVPVPADGSEPANEAPETAEAMARLAGAHVLLADDNPFNRKLAGIVIERAGARLTAVADGAQALAALAEGRYDCVLMDVQMPVMDGREATRRIRADPRLRHLPVIALTANALDDNRAACLAAGMDDFIPKPVDAARLYRTVAAWLGAAAPAALDPQALAALADMVGGDTDALAGLFDLFVANADGTVAEMAEALARRDLQSVAMLGHRLKSSARTIGATAVADACLGIERAASLAEAAPLHAGLPALLAGVRAVIEVASLDRAAHASSADKTVRRPPTRQL